MKYKTLAELHELDAADLSKEIQKADLHLLSLRMKKSANELKQTHEIKECRRYLARIKTVQSSRVAPEFA